MNEADTEVSRLKNIGPVTVRWLNEIGIYTEQELRAVGAVEAYQRISLSGQPTSLNLLYALHGALTDTAWNALSTELKAQLKAEVDEPYTTLD